MSQRFTMFKNLEPLLIFGYQSSEGSLLKVFLQETTKLFDQTSSSQTVVVDCADSEKSKQLVDLGIGSYVKLYNIQVILATDYTHQQHLQQIAKYILTENSGIRSITVEMELLQQKFHGTTDQH